jgi:membrane-bound serine protease (ClpP class)
VKKHYWLLAVFLLCFAAIPVAGATGSLVEPLDLGYNPDELALDWTALSLFGVGALLLFIELFIPGFGICGISGLVCILASFYYAMGASRATLSVLAAGVLLVVAIGGFLLKSLPKNPIWNLFVLKNKQQSTAIPEENKLTELVGRKGKTETLLRPSGVAMVDGKRLDVVTEGEYLPSGTDIIINKVVGNKIFVAKEQ